MLTPRQLYVNYSINPCYEDFEYGSIGYGTPYNLQRLIKFIKHLKYPCIQSAPYISDIKNTGQKRIGLPYKFLTRIDAEAFSEIQPTISSGTSHAIRNAVDICRSCDIEVSQNYALWESRMATEYLQHFGGNSLVDCLMILGPDLVSDSVAYERATGCGIMSCLPNTQYGAAGADHICVTIPPETMRKCRSCGVCSEADPLNPCCSPNNCEDYINKCCNGIITTRDDFSFFVPSDDNYFSGNQQDGFVTKILKHVGILKRKSYGGYANFIDNSGPNFYACRNDVFLQYFQGLNGYDYKTDLTSTSTIDRCRTISLINYSNVNENLNTIKDLLYNGYGIVLMSNVGFPDVRDSTGLSYPDKIWYHTYSIVAYDDTKLKYPECVYLLTNTWGSWNSGGEPYWGSIPAGSFLVTESHLRGMISFNQTPSLKGCKKQSCPPPCNDPGIQQQYAACTEDTSCTPFDCKPRQRAFGLVFAISTTEGFPKRDLDHKQFLPINIMRTLNNPAELFFKSNQ
jgi:hypothetical protein